MDYWAAITVPITATAQAPKRKEVLVCPGVVKQVWLFFPKGHVGTTKIRILRFEHQIWPTNLDGWYLGDGTTIEFPENYPLLVRPYVLNIEGYNTSTTYSHTVYVRFTILLEERAIVPLPPRSVEIPGW